MLTLSQTFTDAFSMAEVEPVLLVQLWTTTTASQAFCTGSRRLDFDGTYNPFTGGTITGVTAAPSIANVSPLATGLDPFERTIERNHLTVTFHDDGALRDFVVANRIMGQTVTVKLGTADMKADADWAQVFRGMVEGVRPREGQIDLVCSDTFRFLDRPYQGNWLNRHPLQAISKVLDDCGTPSDLVDSTSMDPASHSGIGHYVVNYLNLVKKDPLRCCHALARAMVGSLFVQENGVAKFIRFDPAATVRASWGVDDVREFQQLGTEIINEIEATVTTRHEHLPGDSDSVAVFAKDSTSQTNFAGPGESTRAFIRSVEFDLEDLQAVQSVGSDITTTGACSLDVGNVAGLPGTRVTAGYTTGSWAHPSEAMLSSSRPAYLLINDEVMKATASTSTAEIRYDQLEYDAAGTSPTVTTVPGRAVFTVDAAGRGQMGTTAAYHQVPMESPMAGAVTDVTMAHDFAAVQLQRFANGCPSVSVTTSLREWAVQVGDLVTLDGMDVFLGYGFDGVGTGVKWEVTSKELRLDDSAAEILWTLVYATESSPPSISQAFEWPDRKPGTAGAARAVTECGHIVSGLEVSGTGGLGVSVAPGTAAAGPTVSSLHAARPLTMSASMDAFIDYGVSSGQIGIISQALGGQEPNTPPGAVRLAKVVTGASSVSSVVDLRMFGETGPQSIDAAVTSAGVNLLHNPGFESWACGGGHPPDQWMVDFGGSWGADIHRDSVEYFRGRYSVRIDGTSNTLTSKPFKVEPGRVYALGAAVKAASSSSVVGVGVAWFSNDGVQLGSVDYGVASSGFSGTWTEASGRLMAHPDASTARVKLFYSLSGASVWFDNVRMMEVPGSFHATTTASTQTITASTTAKITFDTEVHDLGAMYSAVDSRFTAPRDGLYDFKSQVQALASGAVTGFDSAIKLVKNGAGSAVVVAEGTAANDGNQSGRWQFSINTGRIELEAFDTIEIQITNSSGKTLTVQNGTGQTWFMGGQS